MTIIDLKEIKVNRYQANDLRKPSTGYAFCRQYQSNVAFSLSIWVTVFVILKTADILTVMLLDFC
jgi:hypothetical protein